MMDPQWSTCKSMTRSCCEEAHATACGFIYDSYNTNLVPKNFQSSNYWTTQFSNNKDL